MLDPQAQRFLATLQAGSAPPMNTVTPPVARFMHAQLVARLAGPAEAVANVAERTVPGPRGPIPVRIYTPAGAPPAAPALVYYHGGGYVIGDLAMADEVCRRLANAVPCVVISVDYRLAPEFPYPGPIDDAYAAALWVFTHAAEIGVDPQRIAVGGDSAGGGLAAVTALMSRDRGTPHIAFQVLVYPAADPDPAHASLAQYGRNMFLTLDTMQWFSQQHIPAGTNLRDPYLYPMFAQTLAGLPPALVITAEIDPIRDGGEAYGRRMQREGVAVTITRYPGMLHGFFLYPTAFDRASEAVAEVAAALRSALQVGEPAARR